MAALRNASATASVTVWGATAIAAGAAEAAARVTYTVLVTVLPISLLPLTVYVLAPRAVELLRQRSPCSVPQGAR